MQRLCASCATPVPADEINADLGLAHCPACDTVFPLDQAVAAVPATNALEVPLSMDVAENENGLVIEHRWRSAQHVGLAFFCIVWWGFLIFWYASLLGGGGADLSMATFPLIHVAVGVGLAYYTAAGFVNHTTLTVARSQLEVTHGPMPWYGHRLVPTSSLEQLYCEKKVRRTKNGTRITYQVNAALRDMTEVVLVRGLGRLDDAQYLEWKIEQRLGITDRSMPGEVGK